MKGRRKMQNKPFGPVTAENPFFGSNPKTSWTKLARRGGDRVAILLEDLRKRISVVEGLTEELVLTSEAEGWAPTYSLEGKILATAHIGAASLEVELRMDAAERERLLASKRLSNTMRRALEGARDETGEFTIRFAIKRPADIASVSRWIVLRSR
jgi:hypothetical protein